ncbi:MAG: hypothetical protein WDO56_36550 [Gammaproteobacteria bacterium]
MTVSVAVFVWQCAFAKPTPALGVLVLVAVLMAACIAVVVRRRFWHFADEVIDEDGVIVVRRGSAQARISVAEIKQIDAAPYSTAWSLRIRLRQPAPPFGDVITYLPDNWTKIKGHDIERVTDDVRKRLRCESAA